MKGGWRNTELENLISFVIGGDWGKDLDSDNADLVEAYCIRGSEIRDWNKDKGRTAALRKVAKSSLEKRKLQEGDILVEISGGGPDQPVGRTVIIEKDVLSFEPNVPKVCTNFLRLVRLVDEVDKKFVNYYLTYFYNTGEVINYQGGSNNLRNLKFSEYSKINIPLAPLPEQKRIVAKLDKLFAHLDHLKARLEKIPSLLKQFRQTVLTQAVTGKLTEEWRKGKKLSDAKEIFEGIQNHLDAYYTKLVEQAQENGKRKPKDHRTNKKSIPYEALPITLPNGWDFYRLEDITYLVTDGTHRTPKYQSEGVKFLSVKNVRPFKINDSDVKFISEEEYTEINSRCNPEKGDILYTKVGATFGYACVTNLEYQFSIFVSLALIKPIKEYTLPKYMEVVMNSELVFNQARERVTGIGTPDLHLIEIRDFKIPLCSIEEQKEIVRRVESLFALADRIETSYKTLHAKIGQLPQAILSKAFRRELLN